MRGAERRLGGMRFANVLREDAPDPRLHLREQARRMPVPVLGLVPQRHLEDWDALGVSSGTRNGVLDSYEVSISYTLWRNPDDPADAVNLAEPDEQQREALATQTPWPRPSWLVEQVGRMRYPMLWECVRTRWCRDPRETDTVGAQLVAHVNHILVNQFRRTRVLGDTAPFRIDNPVDARCLEPGITVRVDGVALDGVRIDTDPDVYGLGAELGAGAVLAAAIPRDALSYLDLVFAVRPV